MSHLYSVSKSGDQLCPLGFHPQVRWPTRCKRCFRDYKEHGTRKNDETASSTPSLNKDSTQKTIRSWTSTSNLLSSTDNNNVIEITAPLRVRQRPSSWSSTPDLNDSQKFINSSKLNNEEIVVNVQIPVRRRNTTTNLDTVEESFTLKRPSQIILPATSIAVVSQQKPIKDTYQPCINKDEESIIINKTDSLAERVRKMQLIKRQGSLERELVFSKENLNESTKLQDKNPDILHQSKKVILLPKEKTIVKTKADLPPIPVKVRKELSSSAEEQKTLQALKQTQNSKTSSSSYGNTNKDAKFLIHLKDNKLNNTFSPRKSDPYDIKVTKTTELSSANQNEDRFREENEILRNELETIKERCERAERDKSDILLRRLATFDTIPNRSSATEAFKLQQKVNEMKQQIEDMQDEKRDLNRKLKEITEKFKNQATVLVEETLRAKLEQAEKMCEALMDENEDMKRDLKNMESEMDELQDNFREEQADEYVSVKKELEQTTKNCRILSFKLKKSDRKVEQLESEIQGSGAQTSSEMALKIKQLEDELKVANEVAKRLQNETEQNQKVNKKPPNLSKLGKSNSDSGGKFSRASLTRGGSQEDPVQLLRDLQDSAEREADLREQLKFSEEEAECLRKKSSRVEEENESLIMQLKKMASKTRIRSNILKKEDVEKDEGISDEEDTAELKLQLELNEQESAVLRRKVEELEKESELDKRLLEEMREKINLQKSPNFSKPLTSEIVAEKYSHDPLKEKKIQVLEDEVNELRKKIIEKDRDLDRIQAESCLSKTKAKLSKTRMTSQDTKVVEAQNIDLKHKLQVVEQEASILRTKTQNLEQENDKFLAEIKKLQLQGGKSSTKREIMNNGEDEESKSYIKEIEKECQTLKSKIKSYESAPITIPDRIPKIYSDSKTKLQLKKMIEELENEITETRLLVSKISNHKIETLETDNRNLKEELTLEQSLHKNASHELSSKTEISAVQINDLEAKLHNIQAEYKQSSLKIINLEENLAKQVQLNKNNEAKKSSVESQIKAENIKLLKMEKEVEKYKNELTTWESKAKEFENDLTNLRKHSEKRNQELEKEIEKLKKKIKTDPSNKRLLEIQNEKQELEESLLVEGKKFIELKGQYELLEEEFVLFKAQLTTEKEKLENDIKASLSQVKLYEEKELSHENEKAELAKKNSSLQRKLIEYEHSSFSKVSTTSNELEKNRLKAKLDEKIQEYEKLSKQHEMVADQLYNFRKENDDIKRKLDDFERINKAQRTLSDHNATLENELKKLKTKLDASEIAVKAEVASTRLRYETQLNTLQNELISVHRQCDRIKKDKDSYKQLLEAAQKNIAELKQSRKSYLSNSSGDEDDKSKIHLLEQQIGCFEDEISDLRLEASKTKTEMVSEKSAFEIKISEMQSKLNEFEEERILGSSKVPGTKTRLELSWQKEREEQQRLLAETATLAKDLRQTLFEFERERDKERLESRRKIDQIKKATEEELEEGRRKISELQSDLLELRDAHAKLRTGNEKLRRDRDRYERDRESNFSTKRKLELIGDKKVCFLLQTVDEVVKFVPNLAKDSDSATNIHKSSLTNSKLELSTVLTRLIEASEELRRCQRYYDEEKEREKIRKSGMRRATSQEHDSAETHNKNRPIARLNKSSQGSLYRKSISLDQSIQNDQQIWKDSDVGSMSSIQSFDSEYGFRRGDSSLDSRLSVESTQSDMPRRKKKKGIMGKLKSLTKGNRLEHNEQQFSDSDLSLAGDTRSSKKDLKNRISGMFKRSGSTSRASSLEKNLNDSQQRPISISSTIPSKLGTQEDNISPKKKPPTNLKKSQAKPNI